MDTVQLENVKNNPLSLPLVWSAGFAVLCGIGCWIVLSWQLPAALLFLLLIPAAIFSWRHLMLISLITCVIFSAGLFIVAWLNPDILSITESLLYGPGISILILFAKLVMDNKTAEINAVDRKLQAAGNSAGVVIIWQKPDNSYGFVSSECEKLTGYSCDEAMRELYFLESLVVPDDVIKLRELVSTSREIQHCQQTIRLKHRSGEIRWVDVNSQLVIDSEGSVSGRNLTLVDITDYKKEKDQLHKRYEQLLLASEGTEDGIWDLDLISNHLAFNPKYATMIGFQPDRKDYRIEDFYALIHPDDLPKVKNALQNHLTWVTSSYQVEYRLLTRYGKWTWVLDRGRIIDQDDRGNPARMVGTHVNITRRKEIEEALLQSEEKFRQLAENMREVFWLQERESGQFIYISPAFSSIWGRSTDDLMQNEAIFLESVYIDDFDRVLSAYKNLVGAGEMFNEEYRILQPNKQIRWVWSRAYPIQDQNNHFYRIAGITEDITKRKEMELALRRSELRYRDLIELQGGGVGILSADYDIEYMNPAGHEIFGLPDGKINGRNLQEFLDEDQFNFLETQEKIRKQGVESTFELQILRPDNETRSLLLTSTPRFNDDGEFMGTIVVFRDITKQKQTEDRLRFMGLHDSLTGLYNRTYFEEKVQQYNRSGPFPLSVIIADLDGLKTVNDHYGHAEGDELIRMAAKTLQSSLRSDDVITRIGGDEFAILMPGSDGQILEQVKQRIEENVRSRSEKKGKPWQLSLSIGGYTCTKAGQLSNAILEADKAMYDNKNRKRRFNPKNN